MAKRERLTPQQKRVLIDIEKGDARAIFRAPWSTRVMKNLEAKGLLKPVLEPNGIGYEVVK